MIRLIVVVIALAAACKRTERLPSEPATEAPSPAAQELAGQRPAQPPEARPTPPPTPTPTPAQPAEPIAQPTGCVADRIQNLTRAEVQLPECADGAQCRTDCQAGNAPACFALGAGIQSARRDEAMALFSRACELGMAIACTNYGASIWGAPGATAESEACARRIFEKACGVKEPYSCGMLGRMAVAAATDEPSRAAARAQLERTCTDVGGPPCKMLADALKAGKLGAFEPAQVQSLLQRACDGGDGAACQDIGRQ